MYYPVDSIKILGHPLPIKQANEASSIIWENLAVTPKELNRNRVLFLVFMTVFLIAFVFTAFVFIKSYVGDFVMKFS